MSSVVAKPGAPAAARPPRVGRLRLDHDLFTWPALASAISAVAFLIVQPNVGDLQAALARAAAARDGVGLGYWFQWFGGGATPGNYSVLTPTLSGWIGAPLLGALATVAITVLSSVAVRGLSHPVAATWVASFVCGLNLWSGRVPFALGTAAAVGAYVALRHRQMLVVWALAVVAGLSSPVTGAFLAFVLGGAFLVEPAYRRRLLPVVAVAFLTLVGVAVFFGSPGPQPYSIWTALYSGASALFMLLARPAPSVRVCLWLTAIAGLAFAIIPTGMGSNWNRMPWIWLPVGVVATATAVPWKRVLVAVLPALIMCTYLTAADVVHALNPAASASYYDSLISQLDDQHDLTNYRLEVVQDASIHTAAFALIGHAALAGGYETQEQAKLNAILQSPDLDATSYKVWLDNNAVGYVAFNKLSSDDSPEYRLLKKGGLPYLSRASSDRKWTLYRVRYPTPIVPEPQALLHAGQAALTIFVPCGCVFAIRVRYSNFLQLKSQDGKTRGTVKDDGFGWTVLKTPDQGTYVLSGSVTKPLNR